MPLKNKITLHKESPLIMPQDEVARCVIDENSTMIHANEEFCEILGIKQDTQYQTSDIFTFEDDIDIQSLESGEYDVYIKDKAVIESFYFDWVTTGNNKRFLIASSATDGLEHETSENIDTLIESLKTQTTATPFENISHDILIMADTNGRILSANKQFQNMLGYTGADIQLLEISDLFTENDQKDFESHTSDKRGNAHWIEWTQTQENGMRYFCGRDITGIKEQEQNLLRRERQLSEAEAIGRMGHWHWLIGDEEISWSEEIFRVFGLDKDEFKPSINALTPLIHKRDLGRVVQIFQRAMIEEKSYDMDFRITQPGGEIRFVSCEGRCEKDAEGEVVALYGIIQDMTERMLYEQNLKRAKDTSEQAYAAKSRFLANMSHELRTPLNAIIGFSEMIESQMLGPLFNDKYVEYAASIKESGHHLLDLISDILDMSKIEAGKHTLDLEEVNIKAILERASHMIQGRAQEQGVSLRTSELNSSDITINGDRRALTQIFLNLLSNAVKFTPTHGSVWIECIQAQEHLSIKVCDSGVGIPPNKLAAVLRPFEQASNEYIRDHEGTGLGLSITKELVELHGGTMAIESKLDVGTTVHIRLPYDGAKNPNT